MSDLEEVDVEQQLKAAEESGDNTDSIVLSEKDDTDDEDNDAIEGTDNLTRQRSLQKSNSLKRCFYWKGMYAET